MSINARETDRNTVEVKLYGAIGYWVTDGDSFSALIKDLEVRGYKNMVLRLHSHGGSVVEGNVMYNALLNTKMKVKIIIDGMAASMASIIILAASEVEIADNALVMVHRPRTWAEGNADDILSSAKVLRDMEGIFIRRYGERTKMSPADIQAKYLNGSDVWLNAEEAVAAGFASKVVPATAKDVEKITVGADHKPEDIYSRYAASLNIDLNENKMKSELIKKYNLQGVTESSPDAYASINRKRSSKATPFNGS
jgi:ATP-dependent protease ClpP protease subunit